MERLKGQEGGRNQKYKGRGTCYPVRKSHFCIHSPLQAHWVIVPMTKASSSDLSVCCQSMNWPVKKNFGFHLLHTLMHSSSTVVYHTQVLVSSIPRSRFRTQSLTISYHLLGLSLFLSPSKSLSNTFFAALVSSIFFHVTLPMEVFPKKGKICIMLLYASFLITVHY